MAPTLPSHSLRRASIKLPSCTQQIRHASLLRRPHRPYTFTQLITLSDGSTYTHRTTSPLPIFRSTKDTRNHPIWQPSLSSLKNVEQDEAGKLRAFRNRFGRGWDVDADVEGEEGGSQEESLMDLISGGQHGTQGRLGGESEKGEDANGEVEMVMVKRGGVLVKVPKKEDKLKQPKTSKGWGGVS